MCTAVITRRVRRLRPHVSNSFSGASVAPTDAPLPGATLRTATGSHMNGNSPQVASSVTIWFQQS